MHELELSICISEGDGDGKTCSRMYRLALGLAVIAYPQCCCLARLCSSSLEGPTLSGENNCAASSLARGKAEACTAALFSFGTAAIAHGHLQNCQNPTYLLNWISDIF